MHFILKLILPEHFISEMFLLLLLKTINMNLLNEQGILNLDEVVTANPSWQKIMADGIVTSEELAE